MSKDTIEFPWRHPFEEDTKATSEIAPPLSTTNGKMEILLNWISSNKGILGIIFAVILLIFALEQNKTPASPLASAGESQISIMVPVVGFPKGHAIEPQMLKSVIAPIKSFTKTQLMSVFTEDDIERIDGRIIAKKDLAPYRPIFWPSLELKQPAQNSKPKVQILYLQKKEASP
jgi:hypothetical protein